MYFTTYFCFSFDRYVMYNKTMLLSREKNVVVQFLDLAIWEFSVLITQRVSKLFYSIVSFQTLH